MGYKFRDFGVVDYSSLQIFYTFMTCLCTYLGSRDNHSRIIPSVSENFFVAIKINMQQVPMN